MFLEKPLAFNGWSVGILGASLGFIWVVGCTQCGKWQVPLGAGPACGVTVSAGTARYEIRRKVYHDLAGEARPGSRSHSWWRGVDNSSYNCAPRFAGRMPQSGVGFRRIALVHPPPELQTNKKK